jgi:hypothetical protein
LKSKRRRACSWLCSLPVLPLSVLVSLDFSIPSHVYGPCFLPKMLV